MSFKNNHAEMEYYTLITQIHQEAGRHYLVLDRTEFFVEGGGQPSDQGTIQGHKVLSLHEIDGRIWHEVTDPSELFVGMRVKVEIDGEHRLEMSRQHTGQHLLSAILLRDHQLQTVGFHIGQETATIDTDCPVVEDILEDVAHQVNSAILEGIPVTFFIESADQLDRLGLRKAVDLQEDVQVIRIGDLDVSACCGTHVDSTSDLLFFFIRKVEKHKSGSRVYFQFGKRALDFALEAVRIVQDAKEQLEIHESEIPFRVRLLLEQTQEDARTITELRTKLARQMLQLNEYNEALVYQELDEEEELIRILASELGRQEKDAILLDMRQLRIYGSLYRDGLAAGALFRSHKIPGVRGGGGPHSFQGIADTKEELLTFGRKLKALLEESV
ncbi:hypothetical protein DSECCO2_306410 [anaerobic digester metagenome]